jgi:hypothetical protein
MMSVMCATTIAVLLLLLIWWVQLITDETLAGFKEREDGTDLTAAGAGCADNANIPSYMRPTTASRVNGTSRPGSAR